MKKIIIVGTILTMLSFMVSSGQIRAEDVDVRDLPTRERIFVGGFLGLQAGTFTAVSLHLHGGYLITNRFSAGVGGNYQYTREVWFGTDYTTHFYGANVFSRFQIISGFFLHGEYERIRLQSRLPTLNPDFDPDERSSITEDNYFLGAGYGLPLSQRATINILLLYNFNQNSQAYLDNPFFRVGVDIFL